MTSKSNRNLVSPKLKGKLKRAPRLIIHVSQDDIDKAIPKDSGHCMIADAIKRQVPEASAVSVDLQTIRWSDKSKGLRYTYLTPRDPVIALIRWDEGIKPTPYEFRLRGAQVTAMHRGKPGKQKPAHKLGPRKLVATKAEKTNGIIPDVVGGRPPPKLRGLRSGKRREFGMRGISVGDIFGKRDLPEALESLPLDQRKRRKAA